MQTWIGNMLSWTLPTHQEQVKCPALGTMGIQGKLGGTATPSARVGFCVTKGQKLRNVASRSFFQGFLGAWSAIVLMQHCLIHSSVWMGRWDECQVGWKMKDWALGASSNLVGCANLDWKCAILDPANPSEALRQAKCPALGTMGRWGGWEECQVGWEMKDWALLASSKLVGRANLYWKHSILDPANPSESGQMSSPRQHGIQGRLGGTATPSARVGFCVTKGQKLRNMASRSFFQGMPGGLISNSIGATWFDPF